MTSLDLRQGDCLSMMQDLPWQSVRAIITDLPYGLTNALYDTALDLPTFWNRVRHVLVPNGVVITTASEPFGSIMVVSNLPWFRHEYVWEKNRGSNFANTVREPMKEHERVLVFSPGRWVYNPQMQERAESGKARAAYLVRQDTKSENYRNFEGRGPVRLKTLRVPSSVQRFNTEVGFHPQQKPVPLYDFLVRTYTNEGDVVLDPTMGSGTCGISCLKLRRRFIGMELSPERFSIAVNRLSQVQQILL